VITVIRHACCRFRSRKRCSGVPPSGGPVGPSVMKPIRIHLGGARSLPRQAGPPHRFAPTHAQDGPENGRRQYGLTKSLVPPLSNELTGVPLYPQNASHVAQENHLCMSQGSLVPCDHLRFDVFAALCNPRGRGYARRPAWRGGPLGPRGRETCAWRRFGKLHAWRQRVCYPRRTRERGIGRVLQRTLRFRRP